MRFLLLFLLAFMAGCDNTETVIAPVQKDTVATVVSGINLSGKVNLSNAGGLDASSISVSVAGIVVHPKDDGTWAIIGNAPKVAARASSVVDTVKIIVAGDTLVEVPVESWSAILPTNYIVQRNVGVVVPKKFAGNKVQAVFWDNDSIAHVLNLGVGTTKWKFSGFIYTAYNDSQFMENSKLYDLFVRVKKSDSVVAYSEISEVTAKVGNLDFDSTQISETINHIRYLYTFVPNDSSLKNWNDTVSKKLVFDTLFDTVEVHFDSIIHCFLPNASWRYYVEIPHVSDTTNFSSFDSLNIETTIGYVVNFTSQVEKTDTMFYKALDDGQIRIPGLEVFDYKIGPNTLYIDYKGKLTEIEINTNISQESTITYVGYIRKTIIKHYI